MKLFLLMLNVSILLASTVLITILIGYLRSLPIDRQYVRQKVSDVIKNIFHLHFGRGQLSLKVPYIEFDFDVSFLT